MFMHKQVARISIRTTYLCWLTLAGLTLSGSALAAERPSAERATSFMTELVVSASAALTAEGLTLDRREVAYRALLREGFDMAFIARVSLGKQWKGISKPERETYTNLFSEFVLKTYASRLGGFDPNLFYVDGAVEKGRRDMLVQIRIEQPDGSGSIKAGWRVRLVSGQLRIVDIIIEGISMALNQRREFTAVVKRDGVFGLVEMLRARTETLPVEPPA